jgi:integrase
MKNPGASTAAIATRDELFSPDEQLALVGFLAGYGGLTREAYALDLRQYVTWCTERRITLFGARRADIEAFGRHLEAAGRARATVARRLCTIACFYRYAEEEGLIAVSPAVHVRRPRLDYDSHATGLDRNEVGALLVAAGLAGARDHALVSLLALNGLRVSEAIGANIEALGLERGHRTLTILRKGGKVVTIPPRPSDRSCHRSRRWGPLRGAHLPRRRRAEARPPQRRPDRAPHRPPGRHRQASGTPHAPPRVYHRCARRRGAAPGRPGSGQPRRPPDHHALRPGPGLIGPARDLHRRHLPRRRRPIGRSTDRLLGVQKRSRAGSMRLCVRRPRGSRRTRADEGADPGLRGVRRAEDSSRLDRVTDNKEAS